MTMTTSITLGDRLRRARKDAGVEQAAMAAALDVARTTISDYENDKGGISAVRLAIWASLTGASADWLLGLPGLDSNQEPIGYWSVHELTGHRCTEGRHAECDYRGCECSCHDGRRWGALSAWSVPISDDDPLCFVCGGEHDLDDCPRGDELDVALVLLEVEAVAS